MTDKDDEFAHKWEAITIIAIAVCVTIVLTVGLVTGNVTF